ncbi:MAG: MFS transporter [Sulfuricella sp.]|nr:MFS transporter [Sulfuricella sp.]
MPLFFGNHRFPIYLVSQFLALVGDRATTLVFATLAGLAAPDNAGGATSLVAAVQIIPLFLFAYAGGALSDTLPRKWIMIVVDLVRLAAVLLAIATAQTHTPSLRGVYVLVFSLGVLSAFFNPAKRSYIPFLVDRTQLVLANWYVAVSEIIAMGSGLALGAWLLGNLTPSECLYITGSLFFCGQVLLWFLPGKASADNPSDEKTPSLLVQFREGWRHVRENHAVFAVLIRLTLPYYFGVGVIYAGIGLVAGQIAPDNTGKIVGDLLFWLATGALASFALRKVWQHFAEPLGASLSALGCALGCFLMWLFPGDIVLMHAKLFLCGVFVGLMYVRTNYLLHLFAAPAFVGRVMSVNELLGSFCFAVSAGGIGAAGIYFTPTTCWIGAMAVFLFAALALKSTAILKHPDNVARISSTLDSSMP